MSSTNEPTTLRITVSGTDHPGITAALFASLDSHHARLQDLEQFVLHGHLSLGMVVQVQHDLAMDMVKDLLFVASELGLQLDYNHVPSTAAEQGPSRLAITALGDPIRPRHVQLLAQSLARHDANIAAIERLSRGGLTALEVLVDEPQAGPDALSAHPGSLRRELLELALAEDFDLAVQREGLARRSKRLIAFDMDSTLIQVEVIDELARTFGVGEQVARITAEAMGGQMDYAESLRRRVSMLRGLPYDRVLKVARDLPLTDGAQATVRALKRLGYRTAVISGGFDVAAERLKERLGLDHAHSNRLEVQDGHLTGRVLPPIVSPQAKVDLLREIAAAEGIPMDQTIAVGDGANDLHMIEAAGLGVAFHGKAALRQAADTALSRGGLDRVLYLLGFRAADVEAWV